MLSVIFTACATPDQSATDRLRQPTVIESMQDLTLSTRDSAASSVELTQSDFKSEIQIDSTFYQKHPVYKDIALAVTRAGHSPSFHLLEANRLRNDAAIQDRLPQVTSELSITESQTTQARINIEQILIGNGRFSARKRILNSREVQSVADYEIETNDQIAEALLALISAVHQKRKMDAADVFIDLYSQFLQMAYARVRGGVANRSEVRLFELKKAQAESNKREYESECIRHKVKLRALTELNFTDEQLDALKNDPWLHQSATPMYAGPDIRSTPQFKLAQSVVQQKIGELEEEQASRRPQLSIIGSVGKEWTNDGSELDLDSETRLSFQYTRPLFWGQNKMVQSFRNEVTAANAELLESQRDIRIANDIQTALLENYLKQLDSKREVAALAEGRSLRFAVDFKAGAVTMAEAVSILETTKSVKMDLLETLYAARSTELENARLLGILGPLENRKNRTL